MSPLPAQAGAALGGRSWDMTATLDRGADDEGVIYATGTENAGFSFFVQGGELVFDYNAFGDHQILVADRRGSRRRQPRRRPGAPYRTARPEPSRLLIDGEPCGERDLPLLMTVISSVGPSVGYDHGSAVSDRYESPFPFSGTLHRVDIDADPEHKHHDPAEVAEAEIARRGGAPVTNLAADEAAVDGRTARRDRNRDLVLDAVIALFTEGKLAPNAAEVAERSGVSLRSVYRYFEDQDALVRAAIARHAELVAPLHEVADLGIGPFDERVRRFVACRIRLYEAAAPTARATLVRAPTNHYLRDEMARAREALRVQAEAMFEPELAAMSAAERRAAAAALDTLLQFESAEHLRVRLGFTPAQTADVLRRTLTALLT